VVSDDVKARLIEGMRGQAIVLPNDEWLLLDDKNLTLIVERLLRTPRVAILEMPEGKAKSNDSCPYCPHPASEHAWLHQGQKCNHRDCPCPGLGER
jgi:hypothetical protein